MTEEENPLDDDGTVEEEEGLVAEGMGDREVGVGSCDVDTTPFVTEELWDEIGSELVSLGTWEPAEPVISSIL